MEDILRTNGTETLNGATTSAGVFEEFDDGLEGADSVKLEFERGGSISVPGMAVAPGANFEKSEHRVSHGDFSDWMAVLPKARELSGQRGNDAMLRGWTSNVIETFIPGMKDKPFDIQIRSFFGRDVSVEEAVKYFEDMDALTKNGDENALRNFLALPESEQDKIVRDKNKTKIEIGFNPGVVYGPGFSKIKTLPEDYDHAKAKDEHMQSLAEKDMFAAFQWARRRFSPETMRDAMSFIRAENWRSDVADAYVAKYMNADEKDVADFLNCVGALSPEFEASFWTRVGTVLGERGTDTWTNIKSMFSDDSYSVTPDTVFAWARDFKAINEDGTGNAEGFAKLRSKVGERRLFSYAGGEYTDDQIKELWKKGRERDRQKRLFRELRSMKATRFDYSDVGETEKLLENVAVTGAEMLKYVAAGAVGSFTTGSPIGGAALAGSIMYMEEASGMYDSLRYDGNMNPEKAAYYASMYGVVAASLEHFQVTRFSKTLKGQSYLLRTKVGEADMKGFLKDAIREYPRTLAREGGAETFTEYMQAGADYATKKWVAAHENATYEDRELWGEFTANFVDASKTMPTLMLFTTAMGLPAGMARRVKMGGGNWMNPKSYFNPSTVIDNQTKALAASAQLEAKAEKFFDGVPYGLNEELQKLSKKEISENPSAVDEAFARHITDDKAREKLKADWLDMRAAIEEAESAGNRLIIDAVNRQTEAVKQLKEEADSVNMESVAELGIDAEFDEKFSLVRTAFERFGENGENVHFMNSPADLPSDVREAFYAQGGSDVSTKGFFKDSGSGEIYLFNDNLKNKYEALSAYVHENLHKLRSRLAKDPEFNRLLDEASALLGGSKIVRLALPETYRNDSESAIIEEYMARVCERVALQEALPPKDKGVWGKIKAYFAGIFGADKSFAGDVDTRIAEIARDMLRAGETSREAGTPPASQKPSVKSGGKKAARAKNAAALKRVKEADKIISDGSLKLSKDFKAAQKLYYEMGQDAGGFDSIVKSGKADGINSVQFEFLRMFFDTKGKLGGFNSIVGNYLKSVRNVEKAQNALTRETKPDAAYLLRVARDKHVWDWDSIYTRQVSDAHEMIDSIPDEDVLIKLEAIGSLDEDMLRNEDLQYAAEHGEKWAESLLISRIEEESFGGISREGSLLKRLSDGGQYLPTPKSMKSKSDKTLWSEMHSIWNALPFNIKNKFFRASDVKLDEVAEEYGFDSEASFISAIADEFSALADRGYKLEFSNGEMREIDGADIEEAKRQYDEVVAKYRNTPLWLKAPNGKPTNLTEQQWVQVRTPAFKKWFGDWETAAIINEVENMPAKDVKLHEALDKAGIKDAFRSFGEVENKRDGRKVVFPSASAGKIKYHKGFDSSSIIRSFKTLFESAIPIFSEKEILKDGHKQHRSYESYEHYVNKFTINGNEYFIRFTVPVIKNNPNSDNVHSTAVSEVAVYQNERASTVVSAFNNAESNVGISGKGGSSQFIDGKLANFLSSVKPEDVSKVVDENGEPLVVYHGTRADFTAFDKRKIGLRGRVLGDGFYFTSDKTRAGRFANGFFGKGSGGRIMEAFLNIRNPQSQAKSKGYIAPEYDGFMLDDTFVATSAGQIKSAIDNVGAFNAENPDIRFSDADMEIVEPWQVKFLTEQSKESNPIAYASMQLAKYMVYGMPKGQTRFVPDFKVRMYLPESKGYTDIQRKEALDFAKRIADRVREANPKNEKSFNAQVKKAADEDLAEWLINRRIKEVQNELYWQDSIRRISEEFSKSGEWYGYVRAKAQEREKALRMKEYRDVKGLRPDELPYDFAGSIIQAMEKEPENAPREVNLPDDTELEAAENAGKGPHDGATVSRALLPAGISEILGGVRDEVLKKTKGARTDMLRQEIMRKTYANVLTDAAEKLSYGREREAILAKIEELKRVKYAIITIKDGERAGRRMDNFTLRAENIALRIFNCGVRDDKKALTEKLYSILKRKGKQPSRMEREDKRAMSGAVQKRIHAIRGFLGLDADGCQKAFAVAADRLENAEKHFENSEGGDISDIEDVRAEVANTLADLKMFGNWRDKTRGQMAGAVDFLENYIEQETEKQKELVEKRKEENAAKRGIIADTLRASTHNANKDGALRVYGRKLATGSMPFDSLINVLAEYATGGVREKFDALAGELVSRIHRAADAVSNETFRKQQRLYDALRRIYGTSAEAALKRLLKPDAKLEKFSNAEMPNEMSIANVMQLYASAVQENYTDNVYAHRAAKSEETAAKVAKLEKQIDAISLEGVGAYDREMLKQSRKALERELAAVKTEANAAYIAELEKALTPQDMEMLNWFREEYGSDLPALSRVAKRVIGIGIESEGELYMPVKIERFGGMEEGAQTVPVVPKSLAPRVPHSRDFDETADVIGMFFDRVRVNAQFKAFSELYIELRALFGDAEIQKLVKERCGADVLRLLKGFIADICSGQTKGFKHDEIRKASGLFAIMQLGWNLGSGIRQFFPGIFSWGTYIGTPQVLKNIATWGTSPIESFAAMREIFRSETGRRRFASGNMQIIEELLSKPDQNRFWRLYKRYALIANRASDMLAVGIVGQGVYRAGIEAYLHRGFSAEKARELAMADMWQIAERTQASGKIMNMSEWQRRGGDLAKAIGMFSSPPQLMFSKSVSEIRRAIALGIKTREGQVAAWKAFRTLLVVSMLVEGSYAVSTVLWNALLKGGFDDDDEEFVMKQMALGPFGGLFLFGRMVDSVGSDYSNGIMPMEGLVRPAKYSWELLKDLALFDFDEVPEDFGKLSASVFAPARDYRKVKKAREK